MRRLVARVDAVDVLGVGSFASLIYGLSLVHTAAAWLAVGLALGWVSVQIGRREGESGHGTATISADAPRRFEVGS
jgi:hypothetical protein